MNKIVHFFLLVFVWNTSSAQNYQFYALSSDKNVEESVYFCELNAETGRITIIERYSGVMEGNYFALASDKKHLLVTSKNKSRTKAGIAQYNVAEDGKLSFVKSEFKTVDDMPCYVAFTPDMQYALSANWGGDEISLYDFKNQALTPEIDNIVKINNSKGHYINTDPSGKFVYAVFLGRNKIYNYTIEEDKLEANKFQATFALPTGSGPRHMEFHPTKKWVYILNETNATITACFYNIENGSLTTFQNVATLPASFTDFNISAAIRIHPNGKFLYASNRGHNSIAVYEIGEDGSLSFVEYETQNVNFPRDFNLSSDGKYMIVGNQKGNSIMSLKIDKETGKLTNTGMKLNMNSPLAFVFLPSLGQSTSMRSINEDHNNYSFVYPNPAKNRFHIKTENTLEISSLLLLNLYGQQLKSFELDKALAIDVSDLPRGAYILVANNGQRLLKQTIVLE